MSELQKDLVLSPNEYAYVLDETKGNVACNVGPHKMSLSQSDKLVKFDTKSKKFITCERYRDAIQLFITAPEGWYIALKNPTPNNKHPQAGTSNSIPENMQIGCKINISGPTSFALYPGQMAEVIPGHNLRSNQYLVAKVYDADALNRDSGENKNANTPVYVNGQTLIIKGTDISFYIPPTGIEVKPIHNDSSNGYVRNAVTLERLEYCILKDENGNKRYVHGPEVVFPEPTESFLINPDTNGVKRNAIELSEISGVYVKVIADYVDENKVEHKTGEELFITGKEQMIYYPRPEHTFITYEGQVVNHAIAIPKGEGRYIMNRLTGDIKTVTGPSMYLPDPRTEVVVKRTLTSSQCELWYPGNLEVLIANGHTVMSIDRAGASMYDEYGDNTLKNIEGDSFRNISQSSTLIGTPLKIESDGINRKNNFTKPRFISLNSSKYDGAVAVDVWTGYAVNVISKDGTRKVIQGPKTILLDYDQTLEMLELSTGKPKTTDKLERIAFLRYENNRVSDIVNIETSDFVKASVKVSYHVNFDKDMLDKWFSVDNYVKHLCDWARSVIKKEAKEYTISEFHACYQDIIIEAISDENKREYLHRFNENGMIISDVEILSMVIDSDIQAMIDKHQEIIVARELELVAAKNSAETEQKIIAMQKEKAELIEDLTRHKNTLKAMTEARDFELKVKAQAAKDEEKARQAQVERDIQDLKDAIFIAEQERLNKERQAELEYNRELLEIEANRERNAAEAMKLVLTALGPDLAAALNSENNQAIIGKIAESIAPYAIANGDSVSSAVSKLLRGTTLEEVLGTVMKQED